MFIDVTTAMFVNEAVSCSCLIGSFEYESWDGICGQRMPHPGGQEWVRPKRRRRYGDPVSSSTLWVKRQKNKPRLATPRQDKTRQPVNWVWIAADNLWSLNNWVYWFLIDIKQWSYRLLYGREESVFRRNRLPPSSRFNLSPFFCWN